MSRTKMVDEDGVWLLTETGIRSKQGEPIGRVPFGEASIGAGDARGGIISVIVDDHEVWTYSNGAWSKDATSDVDLYSILRTPHGLFVGSEGARVAMVKSGSLRLLSSFDAVPERKLWDTPYGAPPELRSMALGTDGTVYANVHVGWIVRSRDGGASWATVRDGLDRDVHMVATHPTKPEVVFAATAEAFHISHDQGDTWTRRPGTMPYVYQRAVACFPDRDVYLASTARHDGGAGAKLFRSEDEGRRWTEVSGLPSVDRNINTHQVKALRGGRGLAVIADTSLYESSDWGASWRRRKAQLPSVNAVLPR